MSTIDPKDVEPPDDSGSDTFARFVYQAHAMFPLCLYAFSAPVFAVLDLHTKTPIYRGRAAFTAEHGDSSRLAPARDVRSSDGQLCVTHEVMPA